MGCSGAYATKEEYSEFWGWWQHKIDLTTISAEEQTGIDNMLKLAAGQIHSALSQVAACDAVLPEWALDYLKQINIVAMAVVYRCPAGPRLSDDERTLWLKWVDDRLAEIRSGKVELTGDASADFPATGSAGQSLTEWNALRLIENRFRRSLG